MNCDECQEQIFALIEREAVDPDGVREILERCPDCAALFAEMKAALAAAGELPLEEPSPGLEAEILRAAAARTPKVSPIRRRRVQPFPWAVAATALLAVGIGVWAIPRNVEQTDVAQPDRAVEPAYDEDGAPPELLESEAARAPSEPRAPSPDDMTYAGRSAASASMDSLDDAFGTEETMRKRANKARAKRRPARGTDAPVARQATKAPLASETVGLGGRASPAAASAEVAAQEADATAMADDKAEEAQPRVSADACKERAETLNRRRDRKEKRAAPEEILAIGLCYQAAGDTLEARKWLERAAKYRETESRAREALGKLGPE